MAVRMGRVGTHGVGTGHVDTALVGAVAALEETDHATILVVECPDGRRRVAVPARPDVAEARRWRGLLRRVHKVSFHLHHDVIDAEIEGIGHRLPVRRLVPLSVALGLCRSGARGVVEVVAD